MGLRILDLGFWIVREISEFIELQKEFREPLSCVNLLCSVRKVKLKGGVGA